MITDFKKIAYIIRITAKNSNKTRALELADQFEKEDKHYHDVYNSEFDRNQFLKDCGVSE